MEYNECYKAVWNSIKSDCEAAVLEGLSFYPQIEGLLSQAEQGRKEFALGSRYMPRGFYCPSPDIEGFITNMRRGKIAKRLTKKSKPTHAYTFNDEDQLIITEEFYPNGDSETEYLLHKQNARYGFIYEGPGRITKFSVERFIDGKVCSYLWGACNYNKEKGYQYHWIILEKFKYIDGERIETELYQVTIALEMIHIVHRKTVYDMDESKRIVLDSEVLELFEECRTTDGFKTVVSRTEDGLREP